MSARVYEYSFVARDVTLLDNIIRILSRAAAYFCSTADCVSKCCG